MFDEMTVISESLVISKNQTFNWLRMGIAV